MTSHVYHPDVHEAGLQNDCPRCLEHALHPLEALDARVLADLETRIAQGIKPRCWVEGLAMHHLQKARKEATP